MLGSHLVAGWPRSYYRYGYEVHAMKAFGYVRVSGISQMSEGGPERQRAAIVEFCQKNDIELVKIYEESITGKELDRPVFREMRADLLSNGVRTVVIEKLDRLARDLMVSETFIGDFRKNGLSLLSTMEPDLCSSDPSRVFVRQILSAVAEYDRSMLVSRMKAGKQRVLRSGKRCGGRRPYAEVASAVEIVNRVNHLRRQGFNASSITATLNAEGHRSLKGTKLFPTQILRIMKSQK
jgi:DNA invertase Pin-like site-specific DNA recombinase